MDFYKEIGVTTVINGAGTLTRLGGTIICEEAKKAMMEASECAVSIEELQVGASKVISDITNAEAGIVTSGSFAALVLASAAVIARLDVKIMNNLPRYAQEQDFQIIICRHHRNSYDRAFELSGARLIEVGYLDRALGVGVREVEPEEIVQAINTKTVGIAYVAMEGVGPELKQVTKVAHEFNIPIIIDAANQVPPLRNLTRFIEDGADLVAMSGGKALRGPQSSGFLFGKKELVLSALLQQLDMDVVADSWLPPRLLPQNEYKKLKGVPRHGMGRGFKVGKEEIAGAITALQNFVKNEAIYQQQWNEQCQYVQKELQGIPGIECIHQDQSVTGRVPILLLELSNEQEARSLSKNLCSTDPYVYLNERFINKGRLILNPVGLADSQEKIIVEKIKKFMN